MHNDTHNLLTDIGPATPPPNWCLPGTEPTWERLTEKFGGGTVCTWTKTSSAVSVML